MKMHIKKGDTVIILSGDEKGKSGKVLEVLQTRNLVIVDGINMQKKHQKPRKEGQKGQIIDKRSPIHISKVMEISVFNERPQRKQSNKK